LLLASLLSASPVFAGTVYNFESCNTGPIGVWNNVPPPGCDGWYTPPTSLVPGSAAASVYHYSQLQGLGIVADPAGGSNVLGLTGNGDGSIDRAQHNFDFSTAAEWDFAYDLSAVNLSPSGDSYGTAYIGSFSLFTVNASGPAIVVFDQWDNPSTSSTWTSSYYVYDAQGNAQNPNGVSPGAAWTGLLQNHFYSESIVFNQQSNQILAVSITDLTTNSTTTVSPAGWYLSGGANTSSAPNAFRFSGLGQSNGFLIDNVSLNGLDATPEPASFFLMGAGAIALGAFGRRGRLRVRAARASPRQPHVLPIRAADGGCVYGGQGPAGLSSTRRPAPGKAVPPTPAPAA
jgi:hypothetical protein